MNEKNFEYLKDNIKYLGFGENLSSELEKNLKSGALEFQLTFSSEINRKPFSAILSFKRSENTDMYFLNKYQASLQRNNGEKLEHTFYLNKGKGVTAKEAFNLLDGRAVQKELLTKEGQTYKAWIQLDTEKKDLSKNFDVNQYHEKYGFNLTEALSRFQVSGINDLDKYKELIKSLEKGNVQAVTIEKDGNSHKMFMEADPKYKTVKLYDAQMKLVTKEAISSYQTVGKEAVAKSMNENVGNDKKKETNQDLSIKKKSEKSALLPKNRESKKKGLGIS